MTSRPRRIAFFLQPGKVSRDIFLAMIRGFANAGHECAVIELAQFWARASAVPPAERASAATQATAAITDFFRTNRIDCSVSMWSNALSSLSHGLKHGKVVSCFDLMQPPVPHLMYWLDAPHWAQAGSVRTFLPSGIFQSPALFSIVNNEQTAREMREVLGFRHASGLPYAIDPDQFAATPAPPAEREFDLAFALGPGDEPPTTPMLAELDRDQPDIARIRHEQAALVRPRLAVLADRAAGADRDAVLAVLHRLLALQLADRHVPMLTRLATIAAESGDSRRGVEALTAHPELFIDATAQVRLIEAWERAFTIAFLSRRFSTLVFGECDLGPWGFRGVSLGHVPNQAEHYQCARAGLSVMRWQDDHGLHLKPFEITASGAALLIARRAGLEHLFTPAAECEVFESPADAAARLRRLLADPARLAALAAAGRARTMRDHTWARRVPAMLASIDGDQATTIQPSALIADLAAPPQK